MNPTLTIVRNRSFEKFVLRQPSKVSRRRKTGAVQSVQPKEPAKLADRRNTVNPSVAQQANPVGRRSNNFLQHRRNQNQENIPFGVRGRKRQTKWCRLDELCVGLRPNLDGVLQSQPAPQSELPPVVQQVIPPIGSPDLRLHYSSESDC